MNNTQRELYRGVQKLNDIVKITLGPNGRNVIIDRDNGSPLITNDGVTIAKRVELKNRHERLGADVIKQASIKTNAEAGDGTTSAIVLSAAIMKHAEHELKHGCNAIKVKDALLRAASKALDHLPTYAHPVHKYHDLLTVATNSCANADDGALVAKALTKVGVNGLVTLEMNQTGETKLEFTNGVKIKTERISPYFQGETEYLNPRILVTDQPLKNITQILPVLEWTHQHHQSLVIIAPEFSGDTITALVLNRVKAGLPVIAFRSDDWEDCAMVTNATLISPQNDLTFAQVTAQHLGTAAKILFHQDNIVLIPDTESPNFPQHLDRLRAQINATTDNYQKTRLKERLANLTATAAVISVGCATEAETMEKRLRIEDAVAATTNAMKDGLVQGGGITYQKLATHLNNFDVGERILKKALPAITKQIQRNFRFDPQNCTAVDATTVIKSVVKNSVSAAAILLTTGAIISSAT